MSMKRDAFYIFYFIINNCIQKQYRLFIIPQLAQGMIQNLSDDLVKTSVSSNISQSYSNSYAKVGLHLINLSIETDLPKLMANFLPDNYRAVDLGSNHGKFAQETQKICESAGKKGNFWSVDPYPTSPEILKMTSQEFVQNQANSNLDLLLCKYSIHFNINQSNFFKNAYKRMNDNAIFIIMQMGKDCKLPWTQPFDRTFKKNYIKAADIIPNELFLYQLHSEQKQYHLSKEIFIQFIQGRSWSNLFENTDQQIKECVQKILSMNELPPLKISIWKYVLYKKKN